MSDHQPDDYHPDDRQPDDHRLDDDELIARLRAIARRADPVPAPLRDAARAAFGLRDVDARLAELVRDSAVDASATAIRGPGTRMLSFEAGTAVIECEVSARDERRDVIGQLTGDLAGAVTEVGAQVTGAAGAGISESVNVQVGAHGGFTVRDLPSGLFRLRCALPGGTTLVTSWTAI